MAIDFKKIHNNKYFKENHWETCLTGSQGYSVPNDPGVYCLTWIDMNSGFSRLMYIGSTCNLRQRLSSHVIISYLSESDSFDYPMHVKIWYKITDDFINLEMELIQTLKPELNIAHKNTGPGLLLMNLLSFESKKILRLLNGRQNIDYISAIEQGLFLLKEKIDPYEH